MEHRNIGAFELTAFVGDDSNNAFAMILTSGDGEKLLISMPRTIAGQIAAQMSAALQQLASEGVSTDIEPVPERVMKSGAFRHRAETGEDFVALLLMGDRGGKMLGAITLPDARRLGAALLAEATSDAPTRAN